MTPHGTILAAICAVAILVPPAGEAAAQPRLQIQSEALPRLDLAAVHASEQLTVPLHRAHLLALPSPVRDVIVPNPEIVDTIVKTPTEVYLVAKKVGETNLFFVGENGAIIRHVELQVRIGLEGAEVALASLLPRAQIALKAVSDSIVLTGTVRTARQAKDATAIVRRFVGADDKVINMLSVTGEQQVLLKLRIAELQRTVLKTLGASTLISRVNPNGSSVGFGNPLAGAAFPRLPGNEVFDRLFVRNLDVLGIQDATIEALDSNGLIRTLAEPALVAVSGETANFLAGGEFPIPVAATNDRITVEFKKFGVSLSFTPVVLSENQVSLRIQTEVSRTSRQEDIEIAGLSIPSLIVRRADTTVSVGSGGRLMIAGLLQNDEIDSIDGTPGLKDIPILGALFRSSRFVSNQSELVVMLTAYLIRPITGEQHLSAPTDGFVPASDLDVYLMGRLYKRYGKDQRKGALPMLRGPLGYIME